MNDSEKKIMVVDNNLSKNLTLLMEKNQVTESKLAKDLGLPYNTVRRLISGFTTDPRMSTLLLIAKYFNISFDSLIGNIKSKVETSSHNGPISVPLFSWDDVANRIFFDKVDLKNWGAWQPVALTSSNNLSNKAYALESRPSMHPRFPIGSIFIIDPKEKPIDGDIILVRFKNDDSVSLRDLMIDSPYWQLLSISQNTPTINYYPTEHEIIGVVMFTIFQTRKL